MVEQKEIIIESKANNIRRKIFRQGYRRAKKPRADALARRRRAPGAALPRARNVAKRRAKAGLPIFLFFAGRPVTC
jgi:hypothetical protein